VSHHCLGNRWSPYDAAKIDNLGFGKYPNIITNMMMERLAAPTAPTGGKILRPSDAGRRKASRWFSAPGRGMKIICPIVLISAAWRP
jgi:heterodisulfide reductase subunit A-like polyferredoxin